MFSLWVTVPLTPVKKLLKTSVRFLARILLDMFSFLVVRLKEKRLAQVTSQSIQKPPELSQANLVQGSMQLIKDCSTIYSAKSRYTLRSNLETLITQVPASIGTRISIIKWNSTFKKVLKQQYHRISWEVCKMNSREKIWFRDSRD